MNNQEIMDRVWKHFIVDRGAPGVNPNGCVYRSSTGATCAVGCLIPADEAFVELHRYVGDAENMSIDHEDLLTEAVGVVDVRFLLQLQGLHDDEATNPITFHELFETKLRVLAEAKGLTV